VHDVSAIERVQRRYTKAIRGLSNLSYSDRLQAVGTLSLQQQRVVFSDMKTVYKYMHNKMSCSPADLGLQLVSSLTRGSGVRLNQLRAPTRTCAGHFACTAPSQWNKLPTSIVNSQSINSFKKLLKLHLTMP
jgi:hypothetical protein